MSHQLWQRREPRVDCETMVRLFPPQDLDPIDGQATNLSQTGLFVVAPAVCEVGTELLCDLELPRDDVPQRLTVHGRVVWVHQPPEGDGGMGIEFIGLSEPDASALREIAGAASNQVRKLDVWFDGVEQPVRVEALAGDDGIKLRTSLPFLRLGSIVTLAGNEASPSNRRGQLHAVELMIDPHQAVPFLELTVSEGAPPTAEVQTPPSVGPIIPGRTANDTLRTAAAPIDEGLANERDTTLLVDGNSEMLEEEIDEPTEADKLADDEPPTRAGQLELDLAREKMASSISGELDLGTELVADGSPADTLETESAEEPDHPEHTAMVTRPRSPTRAWVAMAGLTLCAGVLTWTFHTGYWARFTTPQGDPNSKTEELAATPASEIGLEGDDTWEHHAARQADAPPPKPASGNRDSVGHHETPTRVARRDRQPASSDRPRLQRFGDATVLSVPIRGSTNGVKHYEMTKPPGLVVKLPSAEAQLPLEDYRVNSGGFGVIWVRRAEDGLHLRFHFTRRHLQHTLTLGDDRVSVTLSPGT